MQQSFGVYLRQLRRQENLTQTELGGEEFSKSYISAVELEKVVPSRDALHHFAQKLHQPVEELEQVLQQSQPQPLFALQDASLAASEEEYDQEVLALLNVMLRNDDLRSVVLPQHLMQLSDLSPSSLQSQRRRANYAFLRGLIEQEAGHLEKAHALLEYALALINEQSQSAVLDALGTNYYRMNDYHLALSYHQRALEIASKEKPQMFDLSLQIEIHCGNDCRMLQMHHQACDYFEHARHRLRTNHHMKLAGELYLGLGYCTFAALWQTPSELSKKHESLPVKEIEQGYQLSIGYLLQGRTIYQVSSDFYGEMYARLLQMMVSLHLHDWRQQQAFSLEDKAHAKRLLANSGTFLDEASEQGRQILMKIAEKYARDTEVPDTIKDILYITIAYLIRTYIHRATQNRREDYQDTAARERATALYISQQASVLLEKSEVAWSNVQKIIKLSTRDMSRSQLLPSVIDFAMLIDAHSWSPEVLGEISFALGEVAEELVQEGYGEQQGHQDYELADRYFYYALEMMQSEVPDERRDRSYYARMYQNYLAIIEKRWRTTGILDTGHVLEVMHEAFAIRRQAIF